MESVVCLHSAWKPEINLVAFEVKQWTVHLKLILYLRPILHIHGLLAVVQCFFP